MFSKYARLGRRLAKAPPPPSKVHLSLLFCVFVSLFVIAGCATTSEPWEVCIGISKEAQEEEVTPSISKDEREAQEELPDAEAWRSTAVSECRVSNRSTRGNPKPEASRFSALVEATRLSFGSRAGSASAVGSGGLRNGPHGSSMRPHFIRKTHL